MKIALYKGKGFISEAIKWQTRSDYTHAGFLLNNGTLVEAWPGKGVVFSPSTSTNHIPGESYDVFELVMSDQQHQSILCFLDRQVGKGYDYSMLLRFITRDQAKRPDSGKWFCSELVFAACKHVGIELLENINPWEVSPGLLANSPLLLKVDSVNI